MQTSFILTGGGNNSLKTRARSVTRGVRLSFGEGSRDAL